MENSSSRQQQWQRSRWRLPMEEYLKVAHPIPYQGSKRNLATAILGCLQEMVGITLRLI